MDIYNDLQHKLKELDISIKALRKTGEEYAKAYADYRVAIASKLITLKDEGIPATLSSDIARGEPNIAKLKYNEICKEAIYKANLESINAIKLSIRVLENQIEREWGNGKNE